MNTTPKNARCLHRHSPRTHPLCFKPNPKVIVCDLELSPQTSMTYGPMYEASILSVVRAPYIFCFSYMDLNDKVAKTVSLPDFKLYKRDPYNDREVVKKLYNLMSEADYIISHNINFDVKVAKARFMYHKLPPLPPFKTICTLKLARKIAQFPANSLKELALFLGLTHKMETSKYLWQKIHVYKDKKAWREMIDYCAKDTEVAKEIYKVLEGWNPKPLIK